MLMLLPLVCNLIETFSREKLDILFVSVTYNSSFEGFLLPNVICIYDFQQKITYYSVIYKYAKKKDEDVPVVSCCSEAGRMKCAATNKSCSRSLIQVKFTALNSEVNSTLGKN